MLYLLSTFGKNLDETASVTVTQEYKQTSNPCVMQGKITGLVVLARAQMDRLKHFRFRWKD